jgi:hypothetical protein
MIAAKFLHDKYQHEGLSARQIADLIGCSQNKVNYWLDRHGVKKRSVSEAIYKLANPNGDPFKFTPPVTSEEWLLYGLGLGLFWGEGNKVNKHSVRLGNSDPDLLKKFIEFLSVAYCIDRNKLRFGLQVYSDINTKSLENFWAKKLNVSKKSFFKTIVSPSTKTGTYRRKNEKGVLTVYFSNSKLRDIIVSAIEELRQNKPS